MNERLSDANSLDKVKYDYFLEKFDAYDPDELADMVGRRNNLADEAIAALDNVLARKGLSASILASHQTPQEMTEEQETKLVAEQTTLSRHLWRGKLANACKFMTAVTFMAPAQIILKSVTIGAIWEGLMVAIAGYAGYRLGKSVTQSICSDGEASIHDKKRNLWIFFGVMWPVFFAVYLGSSLLFHR